MAQSVIRLDQTRETEVVVVRRRDYAYRYAYVRARDAREKEISGEDYLLVDEQNDRLIFVLCDGVGQSFKGDLGSQILGDALARWFAQDISQVNSEEAAIRLLDQRLRELVAEASERVRSVPLSTDHPEMLVKALEQKRALGSESTFIAGLIDLRADLLVLAWLGDSRLRIWQRDGDIEDLGNTFVSSERWSSRLGPVGQPHVRVERLRRYGRIVAHSDGLNAVAERLHESPGNGTLTALINEAHSAPASDDISFFELCFNPSAWAADEAQSALAIVPVQRPPDRDVQPPEPAPAADQISFPVTSPSPPSPSPGTTPSATQDNRVSLGRSSRRPRGLLRRIQMAIAAVLGIALLVILGQRVIRVLRPPSTQVVVRDIRDITIESPKPGARATIPLKIIGRTAMPPSGNTTLHYSVIALESNLLLGEGVIKVETTEDIAGRFNVRIPFALPDRDGMVRIVLWEARNDNQANVSTAQIELYVQVPHNNAPSPETNSGSRIEQ